MALVVENGSGKADAESYISVDDANKQIGKFYGGVDEWDSLNETDKERALRRATRFVDSHRFIGVRTNEVQALDWPRDGVGSIDGQLIDSGEVPGDIVEATFESALKDVRGEDLFADAGGTIKRERKAVGDLSTETEYAAPKQPGKTFEGIRALLRPYLVSSSSRSLRRAVA